MHAPDGRQPPPPGGPDRAPPSRVTVWALGATVGRADIPVLCQRLVALLRDSGATVVICDVGAITHPDAGTIDVLARLRLTARRLGRDIRLYRVHGRLHALLVITGLGEVLPLAGGPPPAGGLAFEPGREAEEREQALGVEEVVDPLDPAG